jgi:hypothetical protein
LLWTYERREDIKTSNRQIFKSTYQWEVGGGGEKEREGEYSANTVYTCI